MIEFQFDDWIPNDWQEQELLDLPWIPHNSAFVWICKNWYQHITYISNSITVVQTFIQDQTEEMNSITVIHQDEYKYEKKQVTWVLFKQPIEISRAQVSNLLQGHCLHIYRTILIPHI